HSSLAAQTAGFSAGVSQFAGAFSRGAGGTQYVTVDVTAKDGDGATLLHQLEAVGLVSGSSFGALASGRIAVDHVGDLLKVADLGTAHESAMATNVGTVTTQAVSAEHTDTATADYGADGTGIRVGVLSDSFNTSGNAD